MNVKGSSTTLFRLQHTDDNHQLHLYLSYVLFTKMTLVGYQN